MKNDTLKDVYSSDKIYKTSDGIRFKICRLIPMLNIRDVIDHIFVFLDSNSAQNCIKNELWGLSSGKNEYVPYYDIAKKIAPLAGFENCQSVFTITILNVFKIFNDELFKKLQNSTDSVLLCLSDHELEESF